MNPSRMLSLLVWTAVAGLSALPARAAPDDVDLVVEMVEVEQAERQAAQFDAWMFSGFANADAARTRLEQRTAMLIAEIVRTCGLTDAQQQKLSLAAGGDVKHFFEQVDALRQQFLTVIDDENLNQNLWKDMVPLQSKLQVDAYTDNSLLAKTLRMALSEQQLVKFEQMRVERRSFQRRALIESTLMSLDEMVPLTAVQHATILSWMLDEKLDRVQVAVSDMNYVYCRLCSLPEARLKSLLDARQWTAMQTQMPDRFAMEQMLVEEGTLSREEVTKIMAVQEQ